MATSQTSAAHDIETIRAVVVAYANGEIELGELPKNTKHSLRRYAPSFVAGAVPGEDWNIRQYTISTAASFLGWTTATGKLNGVQPSDRAYNAFNALELAEKLKIEGELTGIAKSISVDIALYGFFWHPVCSRRLTPNSSAAWSAGFSAPNGALKSSLLRSPPCGNPAYFAAHPPQK